MSGPLSTSVVLLLSLALLPSQPLDAKSLSAARGAGAGHGLEGGVRRHRRDLRDSLPYEAQMMSYAQAPPARGRGSNNNNNLYYQPDVEWKGRGLGQALQQLVESDQRREQEAAYLAGLLRLLSDAEGEGPGGEEEGEGGEGRGFQGGPSYPSDYDDTEAGVSMSKPQAPWQGLLDPQLTQALLQRYRQERLLQAQAQAQNQASRLDQGSQDIDQETLRYLVAKILTSIGPGGPQGASGRRSRRDLVAMGGGVGAGGGARAVGGATALRRSRRSLDSPPAGSAPGPAPSREPALLRVKRLEEPGSEVAEAGLQRMKRIDTELEEGGGGRARRRRRALPYDPEILIQRVLQYLPE